MRTYLRGRKDVWLAGAPGPKRATIRLNVPSMLVVIGRLGLVPCQRGCVWILLQALDLRQSEECALAFREFRALRRIEPKQRIGHAAAASHHQTGAKQ